MEPGIIHKYFPRLTSAQTHQLSQLGPIYSEWNEKINVISRQDIENLYERHVLHSLAIAMIIDFKPGTVILDAGTGGGFPGIPLAIMFPRCHFHLVDSTAKKLLVVEKVASGIGLTNITTEHCRLEHHHAKYDFVISRAVASLDDMVRWVWKNIKKEEMNDLKNGILYLKGGDIHEEIKSMEAVNRGIRKAGNYTIYQLSEYFSEPFFSTKSLIHLF